VPSNDYGVGAANAWYLSDAKLVKEGGGGSGTGWRGQR